MKQPIIAVINDDGIDSPGLRAAVEAVAGLGRPVVIAPTGQQTGMGRSLWGDRREVLRPVDFRVDGTAVPAYHCNCSPAMIIRHAMYTIFAETRPDLVVSGINYGENLGVSVTCSGTVGAALEATNYGVPAIAVSKQTEIESHHRFTDQSWEASAHFLARFARAVLARELPADVDLLKIDVPGDATPATAWRVTRLSRSFYYRKVFDNPSVDSRVGDVRTEIAVDAGRLEPDSDIYVLAVDRQVSVTPLSLDFTARADFTELRRRLAS